MRDLMDYLNSLRHWLWAAILTPLWILIQETWTGFVLTDPVMAITALWFADLVLGVSFAMIDGHRNPTDKTRGLKVDRIMKSFYKLLGYLFGMGVAQILIWVGKGNPGLSFAGAALQTIILFKESMSAVRNIGILFDMEFLSLFADEIESKTIKLRRPVKAAHVTKDTIVFDLDDGDHKGGKK